MACHSYALIPDNLDLQAIISQFQVSTKFDINFCYEIVDRVSTVIAENKDIRTQYSYLGAAPLYTPYLQAQKHNYKEYVDLLLQAGVLDNVVNYSSGNHSRLYQFSDRYFFSSLIHQPYQVKCSKAGFTYKVSRSATSKYPYFYTWFNSNLSFDPKCKEWIERGKRKGLNLAKKKTTINTVKNRYTRRINTYYNVRDLTHTFKTDDFGNRLHTSFTNMDSRMKKYLRYDGQELVGIDIKNSQPMMSIVVLGNYTLNRSEIANAKYPNTSRKLIMEPFNPERMNEFQWYCTNNGLQDIVEYTEMVTAGVIYEEIKDLYLQYFQKVISRKQAKKEMFRYLFDKPGGIRLRTGRMSFINELFAKRFPNVDKVFREIKTKKLLPGIDENEIHKQLSSLLQKIESDLVLNKIGKRINKEMRGTPIFTIHDSIITIKDEYTINTIRTIILEEMKAALGTEGIAQVEYF